MLALSPNPLAAQSFTPTCWSPIIDGSNDWQERQWRSTATAVATDSSGSNDWQERQWRSTATAVAPDINGNIHQTKLIAGSNTFIDTEPRWTITTPPHYVEREKICHNCYEALRISDSNIRDLSLRKCLDVLQDIFDRRHKTVSIRRTLLRSLSSKQQSHCPALSVEYHRA